MWYVSWFAIIFKKVTAYQDSALLSLGWISISFLTLGQIAHSYFNLLGQLVRTQSQTENCFLRGKQNVLRQAGNSVNRLNSSGDPSYIYNI